MDNLKGSIKPFSVYHTDAYMIAVKNGFEGTEAEWLESLKLSKTEVENAVAKYLTENPIYDVDANNIHGKVHIQNGGTDADNAADARVNLGIETANGTVTSGNADFAEVGTWADGNASDDDRIGYFVSVDPTTAGTTMVKATSTMDVRGVTVSAPAFSGNCAADKFDADGNLLKQYDYVAVMGLVSVIDNGTCTINGRCMPADDGTAIPSTNNMGYQVIDRIDSTHVLIAVEPGADMIQRIKNDVTELENTKANTSYVDAAKAEAKAYTDAAKAEVKSYTDESVRKAAPINLLDNSDFRNPVNQSGFTSGTIPPWTYFIDRWRSSSVGATIVVVNNGISVTGEISQTLSIETSVGLIGKKLTFAVKVGGTVYSAITDPMTSTGEWNRICTSVTPFGHLFVDVDADNLLTVVIRCASQATIEWAALYEGEYTAETLPEYQPKGYMVEALNCGALHVTKTGTLVAGWWSDSAPYIQGVVIPEILYSDTPHITPVYSTTNATAIAQKEAWSYVSKAETSDGLITFTCFEEKPTIDINIQIEVNR